MTRYILHKIHSTWLAWIEKSNQWIQLDEPQRFIFMLYMEGVPRHEARLQVQQQQGVEAEVAHQMVNNLYDSLHVLAEEGLPRPDLTAGSNEALAWPIPHSHTCHYQWGGKGFTIVYGSRHLHSYIHFPFAHMQCNAPAADPLLLEVFPMGNRFALRINGERCFTVDESPQVKRLLFVELAHHLFDVPAGGWLTQLHASAVEHNGRLLLLSSASGSGKSTMAALLLKAGFRFFADDFIPVSLQHELLYPFPAALSLKKGSLPVMEQEHIPVPLVHNQAGYIFPGREPHTMAPRPAADLIFIRYQPGSPLVFEPMDISDVLLPFMQESWVCDHHEGARQFVQWLSGLQFYRLQYGNNRQGVDALKGLAGLTP